MNNWHNRFAAVILGWKREEREKRLCRICGNLVVFKNKELWLKVNKHKAVNRLKIGYNFPYPF